MSRRLRGRIWQLQNIIHWIKSIAIEKDAAGARAGLADDLAVGHYKPINSDRFLNDCHEFLFHFTPHARTPLDRLALGVKYQDASNVVPMAARGLGTPLPRQYLVYPLRDHPEPRPRSAAPGDLPRPSARVLRPPARARAERGRSWIRFSVWAAPLWPPRRLKAGFIGIELDEHYLKEAIARTKATLAAL